MTIAHSIPAYNLTRERLERDRLSCLFSDIEYTDDQEHRAFLYGQHGYHFLFQSVAGSDRCSVLRKTSRATADLGDLVISVCGSNDAGDWVNNFRIARWYDRLSGLWCHRGHLVGAQGLYSRVGTVPIPGRTIGLNGHSRGGGLAVILGGMLRGKGIAAHNIKISTFGAPRVTMAGAAKKLDGCDVIQYANIIKNADGNADVVPKVMHRVQMIAPWQRLNCVKMKPRDGRSTIEAHAPSEYVYGIDQLLTRLITDPDRPLVPQPYWADGLV